MQISLIVAVGTNGVMGVDGKLPWDIPEDVRLFRRITQGCPVIMGRRTMEEIESPLPRRPNLVLSRSLADKGVTAGFSVFRDLHGALDYCHKRSTGLNSGYHWSRVFIIGGARVFADALVAGLPDTIYRSIINFAPVGDTVFPKLDGSWRCVWSAKLPTHPQLHTRKSPGAGEFRFEVLQKKND